MANRQKITCYLCERENRLSSEISGASSVRCGACGALLVDIVSCPSCGAKNRVKVRFAEHQKISCGRCQRLLTNCKFEQVFTKQSASKRVLCNALTIEGKIHQWKGEWKTAIQLFQQARTYRAEIPERKTKASISIGLCHAYLGNYEKAAEYLEYVDGAILKEFSVMYELARAYGLTGAFEQALTCFEKAKSFRSDATSAKHINELLTSLYKIRDADAAGPLSLQTCILLHDAMRDYETDNIQAGIQKLQRALEINPMDSTLYYQLGLGLLRMAQFDDAVSIFEHGLEFDPFHEQAQFALGDAYFHLGLYECALNAYKQTLHINPRNIDAYHHLGLVYEQQDELDIARGYWEDVLKVNPNHKEALQALKRYKQSVYQ